MEKIHYLLPQEGNFYKANLHCHTNLSDGYFTPEEMKIAYQIRGYQIVAYTDHRICVDHSDLNDTSFLALTGTELDDHTSSEESGWDQCCHICCIARTPGTRENMLQMEHGDVEAYNRTIEKLQNSLLEASSDLGATPRETFFRVTLPLTFPGIFSAVILVFIPSLGIYTVSDMLGGGKVLYIGNIIKNQFGSIRNWPLGAALSVLLLVITGALIFLYTRFSKLEDMEVV